MALLPENANELVAAACGFEYYCGGNLPNVDVYLGSKEVGSGQSFEPATDHAAALKAVKAYAMLTGWDIHINVLGESNSIFDGLFEVCADEQSCHYDDDFCRAVCEMILEAEKARKR